MSDSHTTPEKPRHDGEWVKRAAISLAKMVDEYTARGWNEKGLADFAHIVERRLKRFVPPATAALGTQEGEKRAPVQGYSAGIPWSMHLRAYDAYCKQHGGQKALIEGGCRGGFGTKELDDFIPGWHEELSELASHARTIEALRAALELAKAKLEKFWEMLSADHKGMVPYGGGPTYEHVTEQIRRALKEHPNG